MKHSKHTEKKLTPKQLLFIDQYFELKFDGTEAYLQTYPHVKKRETAKAAASRLLTNVNLIEEVERRQAVMRETNKELIEEIVDEVKNLAFANIGNYVSWGPGGVTLKSSENMTPEQLAAVAEVTEVVTKDGGSVRFKMHSKVRNLELLMKYYGLIVERKEISSPDDVPPGYVNMKQIMADIAASYVPGRLWNYGGDGPQPETRDKN